MLFAWAKRHAIAMGAKRGQKLALIRPLERMDEYPEKLVESSSL